jgi:hypothetical protein
MTKEIIALIIIQTLDIISGKQNNFTQNPNE